MDSGNLSVQSIDDPVAGVGEVIVDVVAAGVNLSLIHISEPTRPY